MLLSGKKVKEFLLEELRGDYSSINAGLAVVEVGDDKPSNRYIAQIKKLACELGVCFHLIKLANTTTNDLCLLIEELNNRDDIHGIIIQLPIPKDIDYEKVRNTINPNKDVDGVCDINILRVLNNSQDALVPCTALSVMNILEFYQVPLKGRDVTIIGRSIHIGKPLFNLLQNRNCTVTMCHSKTKDLNKHTKDADIIISSAGKANLITRDMIREGATLIDVGFNVDDKGLICGDISRDIADCEGVNITPVPGGVGQTTVCALFQNLHKAYELCKKGKKYIKKD